MYKGPDRASQMGCSVIGQENSVAIESCVFYQNVCFVAYIIKLRSISCVKIKSYLYSKAHGCFHEGISDYGHGHDHGHDRGHGYGHDRGHGYAQIVFQELVAFEALVVFSF